MKYSIFVSDYKTKTGNRFNPILIEDAIGIVIIYFKCGRCCAVNISRR